MKSLSFTTIPGLFIAHTFDPPESAFALTATSKSLRLSPGQYSFTNHSHPDFPDNPS
jgi:hypothetical protein